MAANRYVLIVAGGSGTRMESTIPKQFLPLMGKPILMHTLSLFYRHNPTYPICLVLPHNQIETWQTLCSKNSFSIPHTIVTGGETRFQSVKNGLDAIVGEGLVAIHDGVRPLVSLSVIERCFETASIHGNAIPAIKPLETVRIGSGAESKKEDRNKVWLIQTPQVFELNRIKKYYQIPFREEFTDDASVAEASGERIVIVEGNRENIKITNPTDMLIAHSLFHSMANG